jgi:hypothetical protein
VGEPGAVARFGDLRWGPGARRGGGRRSGLEQLRSAGSRRRRGCHECSCPFLFELTRGNRTWTAAAARRRPRPRFGSGVSRRRVGPARWQRSRRARSPGLGEPFGRPWRCASATAPISIGTTPPRPLHRVDRAWSESHGGQHPIDRHGRAERRDAVGRGTPRLADHSRSDPLGRRPRRAGRQRLSRDVTCHGVRRSRVRSLDRVMHVPRSGALIPAPRQMRGHTCSVPSHRGDVHSTGAHPSVCCEVDIDRLR